MLAVELEGHALGLAFEVPALVVLACVEANHDVIA